MSVHGTKLFFVSDIKKSGSSCKASEGLISYVDTGSVVNNEIMTSETFDAKSRPSRANLVLRPGDVIFAKMASSIKTIEINQINCHHVFSTGFYAFRDPRILPSYLKFFFLSPCFNNLKDKNSNGATMKAINDDGMKKIAILAPDIKIQEQRVRTLNSIWNKILFSRNSSKLLDEQVKSLFNELTNVSKSKRPLSSYATLITKGASPGWQGFEYQDSGVLFVTSENVREGVLDLSKPKYLPQGINDFLPRSVLHKGDFLINIVGASIGRAAIFDRDESANINQAVALVRPVNINPFYLLTFLNSDAAISQYSEMKKGGARDNLSLKNISDLLLPDIDLSHQKAFARKAEQINKLRFNYQRQIEVLQELLDKKMEEYFGGDE